MVLFGQLLRKMDIQTVFGRLLDERNRARVKGSSYHIVPTDLTLPHACWHFFADTRVKGCIFFELSSIRPEVICCMAHRLSFLRLWRKESARHYRLDEGVVICTCRIYSSKGAIRYAVMEYI